MVEELRWNTLFTGKVTDIAFTFNFCNNYSHPASLYFFSPHPRPTRPCVPFLMSSSPLSRVPNSQVPTHASQWPHPFVPSHFYTQPLKSLVSRPQFPSPHTCIPMTPSLCSVSLLYTAPKKEKKWRKKSKRRGEERKWKEKVKTAVCGMSGTFHPKTIMKVCFLHMPKHHKLIFCIGIRRPWSIQE